MIPVPPQQASREHEHDGKHGGSMKRGRVKRQIFESMIENFTGAVPNNSDDFKSCMLRWNPYVWLFETTGAAAPEYGNSECQEVVDMIPVPPQQASREHEHSQNDGKHGGSVVNTIITGNIIYANNSTKQNKTSAKTTKRDELRFEKPLDPDDCFHLEVVDQIVGKPFIESSLTDPIGNIDTLTAQTKTIEVMYLDDPPYI
ncbi:unnamed protein product [Prunus armeniaca]|uniref:Uncharacterized protein n=1 Tax=Prunus armeniaca TaxID=36596 RepID=A0A6J5VG09_PRUAR|nr:unnamed protein product [Prunus armeniaca]